MTIQSVKITNLYGNNYEWQLNPDVNILVGANGTYKSTILALISECNKESDLYFFPPALVKIVKEENLSFQRVSNILRVNSKVIKFIRKNSPFQNEAYLSDGEKALLSILNTAYHSLNNQKLVMFLDNPENNLHIDWQRNLIKWIRELNPTCQIIMTTHSPTIWYQGWIDSITHIEDIKIN